MKIKTLRFYKSDYLLEETIHLIPSLTLKHTQLGHLKLIIVRLSLYKWWIECRSMIDIGN